MQRTRVQTLVQGLNQILSSGTKIPCATEQLRLCATTTEVTCFRAHTPQLLSLKVTTSLELQQKIPHDAMKVPHATTKTPHSQINKYLKNNIHQLATIHSYELWQQQNTHYSHAHMEDS